MTETNIPELKLPLDANAIRAILPHRYPFLLVDRVEELEPGKSIKAIKLVTQNEPYFQGHFPEIPIMPGVLQIEALAQTGAICALTTPEGKGKLMVLAGVDGFKFRRPVVPGDVLTLEVTVNRMRRGYGKASARASVNGEVSAEGTLAFGVTDPAQMG